MQGTLVLAAVRDNTAAPALGSTTVITFIHPTVQTYNGWEYLQRVLSITPTLNAASRVRFYFTEAEYQNLKNSNPIYASMTYSDLRVTKFPGVVTTPSGTGTIMTPVTVVTNVFPGVHYVEFDNTTYSTFFIHFSPNNSPLPVELL